MPIPFILGGLAAVAGVAGVVNGVKGASKMKDANDTMKRAESRHKANIEKFESKNRITCGKMDEVGTRELTILKSFQQFSDVLERIQGRPEFKGYKKNDVELPKYDAEELKNVSVGAGVLLGGITGAAVGTAGGFAAAGATTAAVMALGTASTGTAIASLSGVAATNATLAALGGGSLAAGGGGMALGSTILGASTLGVGLLVGGVIFNIVGGSLSDKADEAWAQMLKAENEVNEICSYLNELYCVAMNFNNSLITVNACYQRHFEKLKRIVVEKRKVFWDDFTEEERTITENTVLLVGLLFKMCKTKLVFKDEVTDNNIVNEYAVNKTIQDAKKFIADNGLYI